MRLSIWPNPSQPWDVIVEQVCGLERAGWDGVYFADHFMPNFGDVTGPTPECWRSWAGWRRRRAHADRLSRLRQHLPPSRGPGEPGCGHRQHERRRPLGLGAGWQENEHDAYGIELPPVKQRLDRFEEAVQIVKGLFAEERF